MTPVRRAPSGASGQPCLVVGAFLAHLALFGLIYALGVLVPVLRDELEMSVGAASAMPALASGLTLSLSSLGGRLGDRFGAFRVIAAIGAPLVAGGMLLPAIVPSGWAALLGLGVAVGMGGSMVLAPAVAAVTSAAWQRPGTALGVAVSGSGVGLFLVAPAFQWGLDRSGLSAVLFVGAVAEIILLTMAAHLIGFSGSVGRQPTATTPRRVDIGIVALGAAVSLAYYVPFAHYSVYALDVGVPAGVAAALFGVLGLCNTVGRAALGWAADRWGLVLVITASVTAMIGSLSLWTVVDSAVGFAAFSVVFGFATGGFVSCFPRLASSRALGSVGGVVGNAYSSMAVGALLGPPALGLWVQLGLGYTSGLVILAAAAGLGATSAGVLLRGSPAATSAAS